MNRASQCGIISFLSGIEEEKNETPETTERKLRDLLVDKLHMARDAVKHLHFDRVH